MKFNHRLALVGLIVIFLALSITKSMKIELSDGPDEVTHFYFTRFVAQYQRLPLTGEEQFIAGYKADVPPLFYLVSGFIGSVIDLKSPPFVKLTRDNPRLQMVFGVKNIKAWRALNTEDPLRGEILLWYLTRWISVFFGLMGVLGLYFLIRATQPGYPWLAISGAALLAFLPNYLFISSVISYESLTGALLAFYFLALFYLIQNPVKNWLYFVAGLLLGLAAATRFTPVPALPMLFALVLWLAYRYRMLWKTTLWHLVLAGFGVLLSFGMWILYTLYYFNQVDSKGLVYGVLSLFLVGDGSDTASVEIAGLLTGGQLGQLAEESHSDSLIQWFWALFGGIWGNGLLAWVFLGLSVLALVGLYLGWRNKNQQTRLWIIVLGLNIGVFFIFPLLRFFISGISSGRTQHILFPTGAALILLLIYGLRNWLSPSRLSWLLFLVATIYFWRAVTGVAQTNLPYWPVQTVPLSNEETPLAGFDDISLLNYHYQPDDQTLQITLQWRADGVPTDDYQIELTVLDTNGYPQARWLGQPLNAQYPTRAWAEGDRVRDTIDLPIINLPPGEYAVHLRFLNNSRPVTPQILSTSEEVLLEDDHLVLAPVTLNPASDPLAYSISLNGQDLGYSLWPQPLADEELPIYQEYTTIMLLTLEPPAENIRLSLVGPDDVPHPAVAQVGRYHIFSVEPTFANGTYRLKFEQVANNQIVAGAETKPLLQIETQQRQFALAAPVSQPLSANFAGYVALLGYDLPERRVRQGNALPVTLHWQAIKNIGADLVLFNHLIDSEQNVAASRDRRAREVYSTMLWVPDEIVTDPFLIPVNPNAPDGIYQLHVGLYLPVGKAPVALPLMQNGEMSDVTHIAIGPIKVGNTPPGLTVETANPQIPLNQPFGDAPNVTLLGFNKEQGTGDRGQEVETQNPEPETQNSELETQNSELKLTLFWRSESPLPIDYTTFVHLRNAAGETVAQKDQPPLSGAYPTSLWDPGEIIADEIILPVSEILPPGEYSLVIGLYDFNNGQRLTVQDHPANEVKLTDVTIR